MQAGTASNRSTNLCKAKTAKKTVCIFQGKCDKIIGQKRDFQPHCIGFEVPLARIFWFAKSIKQTTIEWSSLRLRHLPSLDKQSPEDWMLPGGRHYMSYIAGMAWNFQH